MHNENTNKGFFWTFSEDEAKTLVKILHKSNPIDPSIYRFYNDLLLYLYERMTLEEVEILLG